MAVLRFVLPYKTTDEPAAAVPNVIAAVDTQSLVLWLAFIASLTLVPAVFAVGRLTRRQTPRLAAAGLVLAVPGYLALIWLIGTDLLLWTGSRAGLDTPTLTSLFTTTHLTSAIAAGIFVLGHVIGTVLLGLALWQSRAVPRWAALATIVSQPLHFVAAVVLGSPGLDLVAWGLNALGFTAAAVAVLRSPDEDWDLPPEPLRRASAAARLRTDLGGTPMFGRVARSLHLARAGETDKGKEP